MLYKKIRVEVLALDIATIWDKLQENKYHQVKIFHNDRKITEGNVM